MNRGQGLRSCGKPYATEADARSSKRALTGTAEVVPCSLGHWHLRSVKVKAAPARKAVRDTGPDELTRATVIDRDKARCVCCGLSVIGQVYSIQHRKRRSQGGGNCPCNLIVVLGDGTRGCHARIDSRIDPEDEARGYTVRSHDDPASVSVMIFDSPGGPGVTLFPTCDGAWSSASAAERVSA